jgi:hypothetical protein
MVRPEANSKLYMTSKSTASSIQNGNWVPSIVLDVTKLFYRFLYLKREDQPPLKFKGSWKLTLVHREHHYRKFSCLLDARCQHLTHID